MPGCGSSQRVRGIDVSICAGSKVRDILLLGLLSKGPPVSDPSFSVTRTGSSQRVRGIDVSTTCVVGIDFLDLLLSGLRSFTVKGTDAPTA